VDYIGRWLGAKFISTDYFDSDAAMGETEATAVTVIASTPEASSTPAQAPPAPARIAESETTTRPRATAEDAPYCSECGMLMTPNGSCYKCANCGSTSGCS
jgi:ribonucleoside-diphosphate reductase alpha chain